MHLCMDEIRPIMFWILVEGPTWWRWLRAAISEALPK